MTTQINDPISHNTRPAGNPGIFIKIAINYSITKELSCFINKRKYKIRCCKHTSICTARSASLSSRFIFWSAVSRSAPEHNMMVHISILIEKKDIQNEQNVTFLNYTFSVFSNHGKLKNSLKCRGRVPVNSFLSLHRIFRSCEQPSRVLIRASSEVLYIGVSANSTSVTMILKRLG